MSPWERLLDHPHPRGHFVQLYNADEASLTNNVARYLWGGLRAGEGALVIVTPEHWELFSRRLPQLGAELESLLESQQLVLLDAQQTLARFIVRGTQPDWTLFQSVLVAAIQRIPPANSQAGLRAYGEMVGQLWKARQFAAAIRLEQLWNRLLEQHSFSLYCGYAIDAFDKESQNEPLDSVLRTHTHMFPSQPNGSLDAALSKAMDEILGPAADSLRMRIRGDNDASWPVMPNAEATLLWLRRNLPDQTEAIIARARRNYEASLQASGPCVRA